MAAEKQRASKRQVPETHGRGPGAVVMDSIGPLLATTHPTTGGIAAYFGGWSPDVYQSPRSASGLLDFAAGERWLPEVPIHGPSACRGHPGSSQRSLESLPVALGEQRRSKKVPTARQPWGHASAHFVQTCPLCPFIDRARKSPRHNLPLDNAPMRVPYGVPARPIIARHLLKSWRLFQPTFFQRRGTFGVSHFAMPMGFRGRKGLRCVVRDLIISFDISTLPAVSLASISKTETKVGAAVGRGPVVSDQEQIPAGPDDSFCPWIQYLQGMTGTEEMTRGEKEHGRRHPKQSRDDPATAVGFYVTRKTRRLCVCDLDADMGAAARDDLLCFLCHLFRGSLL
ncbi:hypothetical protein CPLU01_03833 [Colletotrichum plurivorum]|uniref:Uncharacterized protein n=1 Tax=Colletotrichum plurivorum TaxID=2175906 RepID=A0A8H6NJX3_9PEZI|nr:hypothetical protein CPLU01_03833 [Colletotrichum plurivorum]